MTGKQKISKKELERLKNRYYQVDIEAMKFCLKNGLTIYASCQKNFRIRLFVQKGSKFKPLEHVISGNNKLFRTFSQIDEIEIMESRIAIDEGYKFLYEKNKNKDGAIK